VTASLDVAHQTIAASQAHAQHYATHVTQVAIATHAAMMTAALSELKVAKLQAATVVLG